MVSSMYYMDPWMMVPEVNGDYFVKIMLNLTQEISRHFYFNILCAISGSHF